MVIFVYINSGRDGYSSLLFEFFSTCSKFRNPCFSFMCKIFSESAFLLFRIIVTYCDYISIIIFYIFVYINWYSLILWYTIWVDVKFRVSFVSLKFSSVPSNARKFFLFIIDLMLIWIFANEISELLHKCSIVRNLE